MRFASRLAPVLVLALVALAIGGCGESAPPGTVAYVRATIGPEGGAIALRGCALAIPPGALSQPTTLTMSELVISPPASAVSPLFAIEPQDLELAVAAVLTLPVRGSAATVRAMRLEAGAGAPLPDARGDSSFVEGTITRLGRFYAEGTGRAMDAGMPDAARPDARPDAPFVRPDTGPLPTAPVVVGDDLRPADFACRRAWDHPTGGAPVARPLRATLARGGAPLVGAFVHRYDAPMPGGDDLCPMDGCIRVSTDAMGRATVQAAPGAALGFQIEADLAAGAWARTLRVAVPIPADDVPIEIQAVSHLQLESIAAAVGGFMGVGGQIHATVVDCDGAPVQRARVRAFDSSGLELFELDPSGFRSAYGNGAGSPRAGSTATALDGAYFAINAPISAGASTSVRLEVWGALALGGELELLGCEEVVVPLDGATILAMPPLRTTAPSICR